MSLKNCDHHIAGTGGEQVFRHSEVGQHRLFRCESGCELGACFTRHLHVLGAILRGGFVAGIESFCGVEYAAEICGIPGFGCRVRRSRGLSQSMGCTGQFDDPGLTGDVHNVLTRIEDSGIIATMRSESVEGAKRWITQGVRILS